MIICSQCGITVEDGEQFCSECGARVATTTASQSSPASPSATQSTPGQGYQQPYSASPLSSTPVASKQKTSPIVWVAIPFGLLVIVILTVIGFSVSTSNNNSSTNPNPNSSSTTNSSSRTTTSPGLPDSFERDYQGTIGSTNTLSFSITLVRSGRYLRGTASTDRSKDSLAGTIETDGRFRLEGYENGTRFTGIYSGQIYMDGTINGSWVTTTGQKETPFSMRQQ
jgi:hypothetical protein